MIFIFFLNFAFASYFSDFIDAIYYEKTGNYLQSYKILEKINSSQRDTFLNKYIYEIALKGFKSNQLSIDELKKSVENIITTEPNNAENWIVYASIKAQEGDNEGAKKAYKKAIEIDPKNIEAYYQLALLESKNTEKSLYYFNKIMEIDPSLSADVYYNIAVLYSLKGDTKNVIEYINKAIKADPTSLKPYYFMALYWEEVGDFKKALDAYSKIISIEPQNVEALNRLAELYISTGNIALAEIYLKKVLSYNPSNSKALWWLSLIEEDRKNYEKAAEYLSAIEGWDNSIENNIKMSYYNLMLGKSDEAIKILERSYQKWSQNPDIAYYLGLGMMDMSRYEEAKKYLEIVVSTKPDNYDARYNLGVVCEKIGDVECFKKHFGYILVKKPEDANVLNYLGYSLIDRDVVDEEIIVDGYSLSTPLNMIEKALSKEPTNYAYLDSLAWGYFKKGEYKKAYEKIEESIKYMNLENDYDPLVVEHKADILSALGRYDEAYSFYVEAYLNDNSKRKDIIKNSALKIIDKVSLTKISNTMSYYFPLNYKIFGDLKVSFKYKKFLKTKRFNYTFDSSVFKYKDNLEINLFATPLINLLRVSFEDSKFYISSNFDIEKEYESSIRDVFFTIYLALNQNKFFERLSKRNNSWILDNVYGVGPISLSFNNSFIYFDKISLLGKHHNFDIDICFDYDKSKKVIIPKRILIKDKESLIDFEFVDIFIER